MIFGNIQAAFTAAYAIGYAGGGSFMDRVGVRWGYAAAVLGWSPAAMGHTFVRTDMSFSVARFGLGLAAGELSKPEQLGHREYFVMYKHQETPSLTTGCRA